MLPLTKPDLVRVSRTQLRIESATRLSITKPTVQWHYSFRAARLVDDTTRFFIVSVDRTLHLRRELVTDMIRNGLECDGKRYVWLGFTESQLKANQFVLFREDGEWTAERLLALLGDLPAVYEKNSRYGEYATRLELSFSSTAVALEVETHQMIEIQDKYAVDGSLTTDGVGMIRESLAKQVRASLGLPEDTSVFPIRLGGVQGVLSAYPDVIFDKLVQGTGKAIAYRPSMYKYDSNLIELEICRASHTSGHARLSINIILLLISLGVSIATFKELLTQHVEDLSLFMQDRTKALEMLNRTELSVSGQELLELLSSGHNLTEPYVKHMMEQYQQEQYKNLHDKLGIEVEESTWLYGIADEEGILEDDEIYVNLPNRTGIYGRRVVVCRSSPYATGDIRVLKAVDLPKLAHLKNCIVFPTKCRRSIPDTMGGGKLDGEMYFVTWDPRLIPPETDPPRKRTERKSRGRQSLQSLTNWFKSTAGRALKNTVVEEMQVDAAKTFIDYRLGGQGLLGELCSFWQIVTKSSVNYARSSVSKELVPLIEKAMHMLEGGSNLNNLRQKFLEVKSKVRGMQKAPDPLERLRKMFPYDKNFKPEIGELSLDSELDVRATHLEQWKLFYQEANGLCEEFEGQLRCAIDKDREDLLGLVYSSGYEKHVKSIQREWTEKYFSGTTPEEELVRASAWYCYGYQAKKSTFAWLGMPYLNTIKTSARLQPIGNISTPSDVSTSDIPPSYPAPPQPSTSLSTSGSRLDSETPPPAVSSSPSSPKAEPEEYQAKTDEKYTSSEAAFPVETEPRETPTTEPSADPSLASIPPTRKEPVICASTDPTLPSSGATSASSSTPTQSGSSGNSLASENAVEPLSLGTQTLDMREPSLHLGNVNPASTSKTNSSASSSTPTYSADYPALPQPSTSLSTFESRLDLETPPPAVSSSSPSSPKAEPEEYQVKVDEKHTSSETVLSTETEPREAPATELSAEPSFASITPTRKEPVICAPTDPTLPCSEATSASSSTPTQSRSSGNSLASANAVEPLSLGTQTLDMHEPSLRLGNVNPASTSKTNSSASSSTPTHSADYPALPQPSTSLSTSGSRLNSETPPPAVSSSSPSSPKAEPEEYQAKPDEKYTSSEIALSAETEPKETPTTEPSAEPSLASITPTRKESVICASTDTTLPSSEATSASSSAPTHPGSSGNSLASENAVEPLSLGNQTLDMREPPLYLGNLNPASTSKTSASASSSTPTHSADSPGNALASANGLSSDKLDTSELIRLISAGETIPEAFLTSMLAFLALLSAASFRSTTEHAAIPCTADQPAVRIAPVSEKSAPSDLSVPQGPFASSPVTTTTTTTTSFQTKTEVKQESLHQSLVPTTSRKKKENLPKSPHPSSFPSTSQYEPATKSDQTDVRLNPKPQKPVATKEIPPCSNGAFDKHNWHCFRANGTWRRYTCQMCRLRVEENIDKVGGCWKSYRLPYFEPNETSTRSRRPR